MRHTLTEDHLMERVTSDPKVRFKVREGEGRGQ